MKNLMDKSGLFVGGTIGAAMVLALVVVLFIAPPESLKPNIIASNDDSVNTVEKTISSFSKSYH
jgi:hypothetical protein